MNSNIRTKFFFIVNLHDFLLDKRRDVESNILTDSCIPPLTNEYVCIGEKV